MTNHYPVLIEGVEYVLSHLDPLFFETPSEKLGRAIQTRCWFTTHAYSRRPVEDEVASLFDEGRKPRVFCPDRYALSFHLPTAIEQLRCPKRYVHETTSERNWLYQTELDVYAEGQRVRYQLFFAVAKAAHAAPYDVEMVVESAYAFDPRRPPKLKGRMLVAGLLTTVVEGRKPHTQGPSRKR